MIEHSSDIKWSVRVMSPHDLSRGMLKKSPYNLSVFISFIGSLPSVSPNNRLTTAVCFVRRNAQSHDATIQLIQDVVQRGYNLTQVRSILLHPLAALSTFSVATELRIVVYCRSSSTLWGQLQRIKPNFKPFSLPSTLPFARRPIQSTQSFLPLRSLPK